MEASNSYSCGPQETDSGWNAMDGRLVPKLMTLPPIAETCQEVIHAVAPQPVKVSGAAVGGESSNAPTDVCVCVHSDKKNVGGKCDLD